MGDSRLFNCRYCHKYLTPPIRSCTKNSAHSYCGACTRKFDQCVICNSQVSTENNAIFENLAKKTKLSCVFINNGCKKDFFLRDKESHEIECKFRKYKCECAKFTRKACKWEGLYTEIKDHFKQHYPSHFNTNTISIRMQLNRPYHYIQLIENHGELFWYKQDIHCRKQKVFMAFQLIGSKSKARKFSYEIEVISTKDASSSIKFSARCTSDSEDIIEIFNSERCGVLSFSQATNYIVNDRLTFQFKIVQFSTDLNHANANINQVPIPSAPMQTNANSSCTPKRGDNGTKSKPTHNDPSCVAKAQQAGDYIFHNSKLQSTPNYPSCLNHMREPPPSYQQATSYTTTRQSTSSFDSNRQQNSYDSNRQSTTLFTTTQRANPSYTRTQHHTAPFSRNQQSTSTNIYPNLMPEKTPEKKPDCVIS